MAQFIYEAKDGPTRNIKGTIEAQTQEEAIEKIHQLGYIPLHIEIDKEGRLIATTVSSGRVSMRSVKSREITIFSQQLSSLIKSGVPIIKSIKIIASQSDNPVFGSILEDISNDISKGRTFSGALEKYPRVFSPLYVAMVRAGESSGELHQVLARIAEHRRNQEEMISRIRTAMAYPIFVALVGISTIVFMLVFVMPRIINLFGTLGQTLPVPTRIIIGISNILREQWIFVLLGLLVTFFLLVEFSKTQAHKRLISFVSLNVPGVRNFARMLEFAHFSRTMELLVKNGIPILNALELAIYTISNDIIKHRLAKSYRDLKEGSSFGRSLKGSKIFPAFMVNLIIVGEESGRLEEAFGEIASTYERDTNEAMKTLISLFEPVMILIMGLIVGFVVIAMLLPIFEINLMAR